MKVIDGFRIKFKPSKNDLKDAYDYGFNFGCLLLNKENPRLKTQETKLVKCLVCGDVFDSSFRSMPMYVVLGRENFVQLYMKTKYL